MKAPDKIYILPTEMVRYYFTEERIQPAISYIRKDALLEWAKNMYEKTMTFVSGDTERDNEIQKFALRIVKHIESL